MAQYGTIEWYQEEIEELETKKEILLNALENVAKKEFSNFNLIDKIASKIADTNSSLKWKKEELGTLYLEKLEGKSEQNDN